MMKRKIIAFGDIHLDWEAVKVILDEARELRIDTALNLGDEDSFFGTDDWVYDAMFGPMRDYRDENPDRELICCVGDKTGGVRPYLIGNYVGFNSIGKNVGSMVFKRDNIIAAHNGEWILEEYGELIKGYDDLEPLVVFHGHSHSMGVLPKYKFLKEDEFVHRIPEGERLYHLEPKKVYWVNPGTRGPNILGEDGDANFAIYDPTNQTVTLRTKKFPRTRNLQIPSTVILP